MGWSFQIARIAGIRIQLHISFLLFVGWIAISQGLLSGNSSRAIESIVLLLLVFTCVLLHELGHAMAARRYGIRTREIILLPIGGLARLERMPEKPQQEIVVALAGPAVNFVILLGLWLLSSALHQILWPPTLRESLLQTLFSVNMLMLLFNLIPAFPMDGGRVLRAGLALAMPYARATRIASFVGQAIAVLFGIAGLLNSNAMLVFIALFVFLAASEERASVQGRASLAGIPVADAMVTEFHALDPVEPLQHAVDHLMSGSQQDFPVVSNGRLLGLLTRSDLVHGLENRGSAAAVGEVVGRSDLHADLREPLEAALRRMRENGLSALPVVEGDRLVGLITIENVGDLLVVRDALRKYSSGRPV